MQQMVRIEVEISARQGEFSVDFGSQYRLLSDDQKRQRFGNGFANMPVARQQLSNIQL
jgi:hypothetical protein